MRLLLIPLLLVFGGAAWADVSDLKISEVKPGASGEQFAEILNSGPETVSLEAVWLASDAWAGALKGLDPLPPGGSALIHWNQSGTTGRREFYTASTPPWSASRGNVSLQRTSQATNAGELLAYIQWGTGNQARSDGAKAAGLWPAESFLPVVAEGHSLALSPGGLGRTPLDWADTGLPTPGAPNAGVMSAWRGWSMVAGRSVMTPALTYDVDRGRLDLAAIDPGGAPIHYRFRDGAWSAGATLNGTTTLPAALATNADGTVEMVVVGSDQTVYHSRLVGGAWTALVSLGQKSAQPPALAYNLWGGALELVVVGTDGRVLHNRFTGGKWGSWTQIGATAAFPPAMGPGPQDSVLDLIYATADQLLFRSHFALGRWSAPDSLAGQSRLAPAVAVGIGGTVDVVVTGADGQLAHSRYLAGKWRGWTSLKKESDLAPSLLYNASANTLELVTVARDRRVWHARYLNGRWTDWLPLGAISATAPALVQGAEDDLEVVVGGADRSLWHNRFRPRSADLVSFEKQILPIFVKQCATCHEGAASPEGLNLDKDHAFDGTVQVMSRQRRGMLRVMPLDPDKSYLFHKIDGTQVEAGGEGGRMPSGDQLTQAEIDAIRSWIAQGALKN